MVFAGCGDGQLYALDSDSGELIWSVDTDGTCVRSSVASRGTIYSISSDDGMYAINKMTGRKICKYTHPEGLNGFQTAMDGSVYVIGSNNLYSITTAKTHPTVETKQNHRSSQDTNASVPHEFNRPNLDACETVPTEIPPTETVHSPPRCSLSYEDFEMGTDLGHGGQAVIKSARLPDDTIPTTEVALREPKAAGTLRTAASEKFVNRADTWQTIDARERRKQRWDGYTHIVGVIDTGEHPGPWIAMEYMDGGDLEELLDAHPDGLPVNQALWIGECVCKGLEIAHAIGMSHLDVKPDNVLLKETDGWPWPKLADWGLARMLATETGTMDAISPKYAAPEQFDSTTYGDPDQLTDIYQTGALVHALLTGDPPVSGSHTEVVGAILGGDTIPVPSEQRAALPAVVDAAIGLALEHRKTDRFDSITEFRKALTAIRTGKPLPRVVATRVSE